MDEDPRLVEPGEYGARAKLAEIAAAWSRGLGRLEFELAQREHLGPASILALAYLVLLILLWGQGAPTGADTWGHLTRAEYLAQALAEEGPGAYFTTAWMPNWYMGDPFRTFYPPLTTFLLTPFIAVLGDPVTGLKAFLTVFVGVLGVLSYMALNAQWGRWAAGFGATLILCSPYQLRTVFFEGNLPRFLSLLALPALFLASEMLLTTRGRRMPWLVILAVTWSWAILSHPQQAYLYGIGTGLYLVLRLFLDPELPLKRGAIWGGAAVAGLLLCAPWALPAYSRGELANVPNLPIEKIAIFSAPVGSLLPSLDLTAGVISLGVGILILALLAAASRPDPRRSALVIAGLITFVLSWGPRGVFFSLLPLNNQLLPERFINFSGFAFAAAAAGILPLGKDFRWARLMVILALAGMDLIPAFGLVRTAPIAPSELELMGAVASLDKGDSTRWALFSLPEPRASEVYVVSQVTPIINGWALENTPHHVALRRYLGAARWSPEYLEALLSRWSVSGAVVPAHEGDLIQSALEEVNWTREQTAGAYQLWQASADVSPLQEIPQDRMLVLGDCITPLLMAFPYAEEAPVTELTELREGFLDRYPALGLFLFETSDAGLREAENRLQGYVRGGGTLFVDMSGMEASYGRGVDFLGVSVLSLSFDEPIQMQWKFGAEESLPSILPIPETAGWTGSTYQGLDEVLAEAQFDDEWRAVVGYKDIGEGRVWFVGPNLLFHAQEFDEPEIAAALASLTLANVPVERGIRFQPLPVQSWNAHGRGLEFSYQADAELPEALVSYTYSPRFSATIDGEPVELGQFEHLIKLRLPAGAHQVRIDYRPFGSRWPVLGWALGVIGLLGLVAAEWWERKTFVPVMVAMAEEPVKSDISHAPCAKCGFLLSEVGPPTAKTYPFQVVHCPICGLSMDDGGFETGEKMDEETRHIRLAIWLRQHDYDPSTVHERWGFDEAAFFSGEGDLPHLPLLGPEEEPAE
jgi:hypothetical protein